MPASRSALVLLTLFVATPAVLAQPGYNAGEPAAGNYQIPQPAAAAGAPGPSPEPPGPAMSPVPSSSRSFQPTAGFGNNAQPLPVSSARQKPSVPQWFGLYNQVRRRAQLSHQDRQRADQIMSKGLNMFMPGDDKAAAKALLTGMVARYQYAAQEMRQLPVLPQTERLHAGYLQYFVTAGGLFGDYLRVQDNLFLTDPATGQPVAAGLMQRKQNLEQLERACKEFDAQLRQQFSVPAYPF